jgi:mannose-1-phosphate guanylyltransferase/mannose-6-phosphate isomerase
MADTASILPVIICGGAGSRLWPLSRKDEPKQFAPLIGETTLFQQTLKRFDASIFLPPAIICNASHLDTVKRQAAEIDVSLGSIVLEPMGRNTAACGVVAAKLGAAHPDARAILMAPADHHITRPVAFADIIASALSLTDAGHLVTFGITPTHPHTGFGYIEAGAATGLGYQVKTFHEKPTEDRAKVYLDQGGFFWNAGIFMAAPEALIDEFSAHAPDVLSAVEKAATVAEQGLSLNADDFANVPNISFDYAIAEKTSKAAVVAADIGWSDIGSYSALFTLRDSLGQSSKPEDAIVKAGEAVHIDSDNQDIVISVAGFDNVGVIFRAGRLLIVNLSKDQEVKSVVQALPAEWK